MKSPLWDKIYPEEEIQRIQTLEEENEKFEVFFTAKRNDWNDRLNPIFAVIYQGNFRINNSKKIIDAQADCLSLRQELNESVSKYAQKLAKAKSENSLLSQQQYLMYSTNFGLKTNLGEKKLLIEAHLRENERNCNLIETHIEFLRESLKTLESWGYAIKNIISLMDFLSP